KPLLIFEHIVNGVAWLIQKESVQVGARALGQPTLERSPSHSPLGPLGRAAKSLEQSFFLFLDAHATPGRQLRLFCSLLGGGIAITIVSFGLIMHGVNHLVPRAFGPSVGPHFIDALYASVRVFGTQGGIDADALGARVVVSG